MDAVQLRISFIYTTNNEKNLYPKMCSKKIIKSWFQVSSQISVDLHILYALTGMLPTFLRLYTERIRALAVFL